MGGYFTDPEDVELFIEDQAFLWSYNSAPRPPTYPLSLEHIVSLFSLPVFRVLTEEGGWVGRGAKSYNRKKAWDGTP
jgi:hypothetical protein